MKQKKKNRPKIKSSNRNNKANNKLGWGMQNKNINTLRKIVKANQDEKENN